MAVHYDASQAFIRSIYTSRVSVEKGFIALYDTLMPEHQNRSTWGYTLRSQTPANVHITTMVLVCVFTLMVALLSSKWLLAYCGSHLIAYLGGGIIGFGGMCGPVLHDLACYFATSDRRRGIAWNFFSQDGYRRPWLKFFNSTVFITHFFKSLILFLSVLYMAREAFSARRHFEKIVCTSRLILPVCTFCWVCILEGMEPKPCRSQLNQFLHLGLNQCLSIVTLYMACGSIQRQFVHAFVEEAIHHREKAD